MSDQLMSLQHSIGGWRGKTKPKAGVGQLGNRKSREPGHRIREEGKNHQEGEIETKDGEHVVKSQKNLDSPYRIGVMVMGTEAGERTTTSVMLDQELTTDHLRRADPHHLVDQESSHDQHHRCLRVADPLNLANLPSQ
jgi:hypothetical protein